jgi:Leucine-rich repeat (LRR) protein
MPSMHHFLVEITLSTNDKFLYPCINDIPIEYYDLITELKCQHKELEELIYLPNLEILDCSFNYITHIPIYPKLKTLTSMNGEIKEIGDYPMLTDIYVQNNKITKIGNCPNLKYINCKHNLLTEINEYPNLEYINCSMNMITYIPFYPNLRILECQCNQLKSLHYYPNLVSLYCQYNQIKEIITYQNLHNLICNNNQITRIDHQPNIIKVDCSNNNLVALPNIMVWNNLQNFDYRGNEIEYIPPNVARFINGLKIKKHTFLAVYTDYQNVHNHSIQESVRNSINNIISIKPTITLEQMFNEILNNQFLTEECKKTIIAFSNDTDSHSILNITFAELIHSVWCIIRDHYHFKNICEIINIEMIDSLCKCFTGRISRLINCLNGFDDRVSIEMSENDQISNVVLIIQKKLEDNKDYTVEKHRHLVQKELLERGFNQDTISIWIDNIE